MSSALNESSVACNVCRSATPNSSSELKRSAISSACCEMFTRNGGGVACAAPMHTRPCFHTKYPVANAPSVANTPQCSITETEFCRNATDAKPSVAPNVVSANKRRAAAGELDSHEDAKPNARSPRPDAAKSGAHLGPRPTAAATKVSAAQTTRRTSATLWRINQQAGHSASNTLPGHSIQDRTATPVPSALFALARKLHAAKDTRTTTASVWFTASVAPTG
mmetsp:Transcript_83732/g.194788  ORF Transcript_83732/g.194788 Transcript_83732/m.194788 type:complete len:222 (-) Transcript_83732:153-818(-)